MLIIVLSLGLELLLGALFERLAGKRGAAGKEKEALCAKTCRSLYALWGAHSV